MRYIDTGGRDPAQALGTWLLSEVHGRAADLAALRWQSGFFNPAALGIFVPAFVELEKADGVTHLLVGSNDGVTTSVALTALLEAAGGTRANLRVGVVKFDNAYFHPKAMHITRRDGSEAAYVGSANLTGSGVASLHVEAGVLIDSAQGDDPAVLATVAKAIDEWFAPGRAGLSLVQSAADVAKLAALRIINVPQPPKPKPKKSIGKPTGGKIELSPLVGLPTSVSSPTGVGGPAAKGGPGGGVQAAGVLPPVVPAETWSKQLTRSDAQRKAAGNQRGSITLVAAPSPFTTATYFKDRLFVPATWTTSATRTGRPLETASIEFDVQVLGKSYGKLEIEVTYDPDRASGQDNYTTLLHLGPLGPDFTATDLTGKRLRITRMSDDSYALEIS